MRFVRSLGVACLALGFAGAQHASAQYPVYVPQTYGHVVHEHGYHSDYSHHYQPSTPHYYSGYGGAPVYQYAPSVSYPPVYSSSAVYAQPVAPPSSIYYSRNTYYGTPSAHTHHRWHPGHYLLGHH